jgi:hypothetical protein
MPTETFPITPAGAKTFWFVAALLALISIPMALLAPRVPEVAPGLAICLLVGAVVFYSAASSRRARFELSPAGLRVRRSMFGKTIPRQEILLGEARPLDVQQDPAYKPIRFAAPWRGPRRESAPRVRLLYGGVDLTGRRRLAHHFKAPSIETWA